MKLHHYSAIPGETHMILPGNIEQTMFNERICIILMWQRPFTCCQGPSEAGAIGLSAEFPGTDRIDLAQPTVHRQQGIS